LRIALFKKKLNTKNDLQLFRILYNIVKDDLVPTKEKRKMDTISTEILEDDILEI